MKKQNIFDLLCEDLLNETKEKEENFNKCITDFEQCTDDYIIPYLTSNQERFNYVFDLNSTNETTSKTSLNILYTMVKEFKELVSFCPNYFICEKEKYGFKYACDNICYLILMSNDINELFK